MHILSTRWNNEQRRERPVAASKMGADLKGQYHTCKLEKKYADKGALSSLKKGSGQRHRLTCRDAAGMGKGMGRHASTRFTLQSAACVFECKRRVWCWG